MKTAKLQFNFYLFAFFSSAIFYAPVALFLRTSRGITLQEFFLLQLVLKGVIFLFEVPCGWLTDRIGYKSSIILSSLGLLLARSIFIFAHSLPLFIIEAILEGIATCLISGTLQGMLFEKAGQSAYSKYYATYQNFGTASFLVTTLLFYVLYPNVHLMGLLLLSLVTSAITLLVSFFLPNVKHSEQRIQKVSGLKFFKNKTFLLFMLGESIVAFQSLLINFFYVKKLTDVGLGAQFMTFVILGYSALELLTPKVLGLLQKFRENWIYPGTYVLTGLLFLVLALSHNPIMIVTLMLILPLLVSIPSYYLSNFENQLISQFQADRQRATFLSFFSMGQNGLSLVWLLLFSVIQLPSVSGIFLATSLLVGAFGIANFFLFQSSPPRHR